MGMAVEKAVVKAEARADEEVKVEEKEIQWWN